MKYTAAAVRSNGRLCSRSFGCFAHDPGPDLSGHELHGALGERGIGPGVARIQQCTELTDLLAERENLVRDARGGSRDHQALEATRGRELAVRLLGIIAHDVQRAGLGEFGPHDFEVEAVRALLAVRIATCRRFVIGHEDAAGDAPAGWIRTK